MPNIVLFDIDNTLINTKKLFDEYLKPAFAQTLEVPLEQFRAKSDEYWQQLEDSTDFNPQDYITFIAQAYEVDPQVLRESLATPDWYRQSVFADVVPALTQLAVTHTLGIFSQGNAEYQRMKLDLGDIAHFFKPEYTFFYARKLQPENIASLPESIIVDDKLAVVEALHTNPQLLSVWLDRTAEVGPAGTPTIHSLSEIQKFV